jgi:hypothetical protein
MFLFVTLCLVFSDHVSHLMSYGIHAIRNLHIVWHVFSFCDMSAYSVYSRLKIVLFFADSLLESMVDLYFPIIMFWLQFLAHMFIYQHAHHSHLNSLF